MPTVMRIGPYRFFFYSNEGNEPSHIHVQRDQASAQFWLAPVRLASNHGFAAHDLRALRDIITEHEPALMEAWHEHFGPA